MLRNRTVDLDTMDAYDAGGASGHPAWLNDLDSNFSFGRYGADDQPSRIAAARLVAEVLRTYAAGVLKVGFSLDEAQRWASYGPLAPLISKTQNQLTIERNMRAIGQNIAHWSIIQLQWAFEGRRSDGSSFTWQRWVDHAKVLNDSINYQTKVSWDSAEVKAAIDALIKTGKDITTPSEWPTWVWALLALGGAAVVGVYVVPWVKARRGGSGALAGRKGPKGRKKRSLRSTEKLSPAERALRHQTEAMKRFTKHIKAERAFWEKHDPAAERARWESLKRR